MTGRLKNAREFKNILRAEVMDVSVAELEAAMNDAVRIANRALTETTPPDGASMDEWHMEPIAESVEIRWEPSPPDSGLSRGHRLVAEWKAEASGWIELGVRPHMIEGDPWLVWEDRETGETVFRHEVQHPGIPAVGYARQGFREAIASHFG
jgi:hypothetical protein